MKLALSGAHKKRKGSFNRFNIANYCAFVDSTGLTTDELDDFLLTLHKIFFHHSHAGRILTDPVRMKAALGYALKNLTIES